MLSNLPNHAPRRRAFTLAELVITLTIMAILAAVAAPRFIESLARSRVEAAARRIASDLKRAASAANDASASRSVVFDSAADSYAIADVADLDRPSDTISVTLSATDYPVDLHSVDFGGGETVTFNMYGTPDNTGTLTVTSQTRSLTVTVDALGKVEITP